MTQQTEELLNDVGFRLATLKEARSRFSDQLAPEFRIFDYLRTDEMGLSTCIASLLDSKGKHGQGNVFLDGIGISCPIIHYLPPSQVSYSSN